MGPWFCLEGKLNHGGVINWRVLVFPLGCEEGKSGGWSLIQLSGWQGTNSD